jgi:hypothetical protein
VQALPSLQVVPFARAGLEQAPVAGAHVPGAWHWSLAVQTTGLDPVHVPFSHASVCVHAFPSLQLVPFVAVGFEQAPVLESHVPATWQESLAVHVTGFDPVQAPAWHAYVCSQRFVPVQVVPFADAVWLHVPSPLHESTVQGLPSSHVDAEQHSPPALRMLVSKWTVVLPLEATLEAKRLPYTVKAPDVSSVAFGA